MHVLPETTHVLPGPILGPRPFQRPRRALLTVGGVAGAYLLAQLVLVVPGSGLGWDETVYVSQVHDGPAAFFSAPRARGISYLAAPVTVLTSSTLALRLWFALLSAVGVFLALWVWRRLVPPAVLGWGGALFCGLWVTLYYGPRVMPNLWCALAALAAVGCFLRLAASRPWTHYGPPPGGAYGLARLPGPDRGALAGLGLSVALVALMRPSDAMWLTLPLFVAGLLVPGLRRPAGLVVMVLALALGCAPWIAEAYAHYGGPLERLHRAGEIQGGLSWNLAFADQLRGLEGRTLCRPCDVPWQQPLTGLWWIALPLLTVAGIAAASRAGRAPASVVAAVTAVSTAVPYLFLVHYAAPRFLLPAYALLAIPAGELAARASGRARGGWRTLTAGLGLLLLAGHVVVQYAVLSGTVQRSEDKSARQTQAAAVLHRHGVRPPCVLAGPTAVPLAHYAGCSSRNWYGHDRSISRAGLAELARKTPTAVLPWAGGEVPAFARDWPSVTLPGPDGGEIRVRIGPAAAPADTRADATAAPGGPAPEPAPTPGTPAAVPAGGGPEPVVVGLPD
ncbi:hypothetical protein [Streptomyces sp. HNM0574]|uniref:hypothetical protein n=1 Tax=Streptomyces sp. HNM0574 TaxID=2714954 RepID=UPI00146AEED6|nr:hypothetical protein [Streptomyces sp. HNM0574]NLU70844.1 hypothetical protein [Streptomyces sp. HNM0574]